MPKVHKGTENLKFRPVVSQCGSISATISTFLDVKLQPLKFGVPSYIKDSRDLIHQLQQLPRLHHNNYIFTSDATSMYTNIDVIEGLDIIKSFYHHTNFGQRDSRSVIARHQ